MGHAKDREGLEIDLGYHLDQTEGLVRRLEGHYTGETAGALWGAFNALRTAWERCEIKTGKEGPSDDSPRADRDAGDPGV